MDPISSILEGRIHVRGDKVILEDLVDDVASDTLSSADLKLGKIKEVSMHPAQTSTSTLFKQYSGRTTSS